jgi:putative methyltransferase (TIGR04325 family)
VRRFLARWLPPALRDAVFTARDNEFSGPYASWQEAAGLCTGYGEPSILEKTRAALLKVKRGEAVYERDSVLFDRIEYSYPVLAHLLYVATKNEGSLRVLDFGGSLGSSYYQNRGRLAHLRELAWGVVEQPAHVAVGRRDFEDASLRFFGTPQECLRTLKPQVLLLSSVLQYLEQPLDWLRTAATWRLPYIIIDRAPLVESGPSRLTIQTVPPSIYTARYPCWVLNESELLDSLRPAYRVSDAFDAHHGTTIRLADTVGRYRGFLLERA